MRRTTVLTLSILALAAPAAGASDVSIAAGALVYTAGAGETNALTITYTGSAYVVDDVGQALTPGAGCAVVDADSATCASATPLNANVGLGDMGDTLHTEAATFRAGSVNGGAGNDTLSLGGAMNVPTANGDAGDDVITILTADRWTLQGGTENDTLTAGGDAASLTGDGGNDTLNGGPGGDTLDGGNDADVVNGGGGVDSITYGTRTAGVKVSTGNAIADDGETAEGDNVGSDVESVIGGLGDDVLEGSGASNQINGGYGNDTIKGHGGPDTLFGGPGTDILDGGADQDSVFGDAGDDTQLGGGGPDYLYGSPGADNLHGGAGLDWAYLYDRNGAQKLSNDNFADDGLVGENDNIHSDVEGLYGGYGDDELRGGPGDETFYGQTGNDLIEGGGGNDYLSGMGGNDTLRGGPGDDQLSGGTETDIVDGGTGVDRGDWYDGYAIVIHLNGLPVSGDTGENDRAISIEDVATSSGNDRVFGSSAANHIDTGWGNDTVNAGSGNDEIITGRGNDVVNAGAGRDSVDSGGGNDRITTANDGAIDSVRCGGGTDRATASRRDDVRGDCETISRRRR